MWLQNSTHPGLQFKRVHSRESIYSVRVSLGWRVLGLLEGDTIYWFWIGSHADYWFWIGSHAEYDRLLKQI